MITVTDWVGRIVLHMAVQPMGDDLHVSLYGGEKPHIGAVALAVPRQSLANDGSISASVSVLTITGHKEDGLARYVAHEMAKQANACVCVACGIHVEHIEQEELVQVQELADSLILLALHKLNQSTPR